MEIRIPPRITEGVYDSWLSEEFDADSVKRCAALGSCYRRVAEANGVHFLDAGALISADAADGIHMNPDGHARMAELLFEAIQEICLHESSAS